jgi:hypothetical protein
MSLAVQRSTMQKFESCMPQSIHLNLKRLIECKMHMTGPFKEMAKATKELEPWYSSSKNTSRAYTLLHNTYLFYSSRISRMTAEDI